MVRGSTKLYLIVGHPISQVKSPEIFNERFAENSLDAVMIPLDIYPSGLSSFVDLFRQSKNIHGAVVTIPYKERIVQYIDRPSAQVSALGAANVIRVARSREIEGDMVDGKGFLRALSKKNVSLKNKHMFIIGCGGAGNNTVKRLMTIGVQGAECIAINTDRQHLAVTTAHRKLLIGERITRGLGAGGYPPVGQAAAEESAAEAHRGAACR